MNKGWKVLTGKPIESLTEELKSLIEKEIEDDVFDLEVLVGIITIGTAKQTC